MKRIFVGLLVFLFSGSIAFSQVNARIKSFSSPRSPSFSNSSSSCGGEGILLCADGCIWGIQWGVWLFSDVLIPYHKEILSRKSESPLITALQIHPSAGIGLNSGGGIFLPRLRANWGLFTTDFRYFRHFETGPGYIDTYSTADWQIVNLNLVAEKNVRFSVGSGLLFEQYSGNVFSESSARLGFQVWQDKLQFELEGRMALDYDGADLMRTEGNAQVAYRIFKAPHFQSYATLGGLFQRYYGAVNLWGMNGGLRFDVF